MSRRIGTANAIEVTLPSAVFGFPVAHLLVHLGFFSQGLVRWPGCLGRFVARTPDGDYEQNGPGS